MRIHAVGIALPKIALTAVTGMLAVSALAAQAPVTFADPPPSLTATQDGTISGLMPGAAAQAISYTITNSGSTSQYAGVVTIVMTSISYASAAGAGVGTTWRDHPARGAAPGCTAGDFAIVAPDPLDQHLATGATSFTNRTSKKSGTIAMIETGRNQNDCQGTVSTLLLTVT